jgi:hypothetical protein
MFDTGIFQQITPEHSLGLPTNCQREGSASCGSDSYAVTDDLLRTWILQFVYISLTAPTDMLAVLQNSSSWEVCDATSFERRYYAAD